jgi:hypothetical protein
VRGQGQAVHAEAALELGGPEIHRAQRRRKGQEQRDHKGFRKTAKIAQYYPKSPNITQNYPKLPKITQNYPKLPKIIQNYPKLPKITQNYPKLPKIT